MESNIHISNRGETCYVDIEGTIGVPEEWQFDDPSSRVTTYEKFKENLTRLREINAEEDLGIAGLRGLKEGMRPSRKIEMHVCIQRL